MRAFGREERGSVVVTLALALAAMLGVGALAVDVGSFYVGKRRQQGATDLAALAAASDLTRAREAAASTLSQNGAARLDGIELGTYVADPAIAPEARFTSGGANPNAVRILVAGTTPKFLSRALAADTGSLSLSTRAVAVRADLAGFAVGSRLARLDGGIVNGVLGALLGANLNLSALDYRTLVSMRIDVGTFASSLAQRSGTPDASYETLAGTGVRIADAAAALEDAARADPRADASGVAVVAGIARTLSGQSGRVMLGALLNVGPTAKQPPGRASSPTLSVSAFDALSRIGSAAVVGRTVRTSLGAAAPGLLSANVELAVGQPPAGTGSVTVGSPGASVRTSQVRVKLDIEIGGGPGGSTVTLPFVLDVAYAKATLTALACDGQGRPAVTLGVQPGVAEAWIGNTGSADLAAMSTRLNPPAATLVDVAGLVRVTGRAHALVGNQTATPVTYWESDIIGGVVKTTGTTELSAALVGALIKDLRLDVSVLGLGAGGGLDGIVTAQVAAAAPALDTLISNVLTALGIGIGQADTWVTGARCGGAVLVN